MTTYFLHEWSNELSVKRGTPVGNGYSDTETVATFNKDILGDNAAFNAAYGLLATLKATYGYEVSWDETYTPSRWTKT